MDQQLLEKKKIYLFTGNDAIEKNATVQFWEKEFIKKHGELNIVSFDLTTLHGDVSEIWAALMSLPMFGAMRCVIVKNFPASVGEKETPMHSFIEEHVQEIIDSMPPTNMCIFVSDAPDKRKKVWKTLVDNAEVREFSVDTLEFKKKIRQRLEGIIEQEDVMFCYEHIFFAISHPTKEIMKLETYARAHGRISKEVFLELVPLQHETNVFSFLSAIIAQNLSQASLLLDKIAQTEEPLKVLGLITWQLEQLIVVKSCMEEKMSDADICQKAKIKPFVLGPLKKQLPFFSWHMLQVLTKSFADIDIAAKSGGIDLTDKGNFFQECERMLFTSLRSQF